MLEPDKDRLLRTKVPRAPEQAPEPSSPRCPQKQWTNRAHRCQVC